MLFYENAKAQSENIHFPSERLFRPDEMLHPCEKVIGIFLQNQIWSRLLDINRLCLISIKSSVDEVKSCQISMRGYQQGPSDETLKKARYQFCDVKFGHRITVAVGLFDYKMCNSL